MQTAIVTLSFTKVHIQPIRDCDSVRTSITSIRNKYTSYLLIRRAFLCQLHSSYFLILGYRSVPLKNAHNDNLELSSLLIYLDMFMVSSNTFHLQ